MHSEDWERIDDWFLRARALPHDARKAFLDAECSDAPAELRAQLERLLTTDTERDSVLESPAVDAATLKQLRHDAEIAWASKTGSAPTQLDVDGYCVERLIGSGGMGHVYEATDIAQGRKVAIKVMHEALERPRSRLRFHREAHLLAKLDHDAIARCLAFGENRDGRLYIIMELVTGRPLDRYAYDESLSGLDRIKLLARVSAGLAHAHQSHVMHRDLKPSNILVVEGRPKLLDFGLAKLFDDDQFAARYTSTCYATPGYAAPEQLRDLDVDARSDVFAIGALLYELIAGEHPFGRGRVPTPEVIHRTCNVPPRPLSETPKSRVRDAELDRRVAEMLAIDTRRRPANGGELLRSLQDYLARC